MPVRVQPGDRLVPAQGGPGHQQAVHRDVLQPSVSGVQAQPHRIEQVQIGLQPVLDPDALPGLHPLHRFGGGARTQQFLHQRDKRIDQHHHVSARLRPSGQAAQRLPRL